MSATLIMSVVLLLPAGCAESREYIEGFETMDRFEPALEIPAELEPMTWIVPPKWELDLIRICPCFPGYPRYGHKWMELHDVLSGIDALVDADLWSGQVICDHLWSGWDEFFYDQENDVFIAIKAVNLGGALGRRYHTFDPADFATQFPQILAVQQMDMKLFDQLHRFYRNGLEWLDWWTDDDYVTDSGYFAVTFGGELLTDFVFQYDPHRWIPSPSNLVLIEHDYKWGLMGVGGEMVLHFAFEDIDFINPTMIFAKQDGRYGIFYLGNHNP